MTNSIRSSEPTPVLMYHDLGDVSPMTSRGHHPYVVSAGAFVAQMKLLADCGLAGRTLSDVLEKRDAPGGGSGRSCVITFDDGHESNCTRALPALQEAGFRATFFVTAGWVGREHYMTWEQVRRLAESGMEIGSHSMTHRPPASLREPELLAEMTDSKKLLEDRLGRPVVTASSPTGFFNPRLIPAAMEAGYRALCVGRIALWTENEDRFRIPRLPVKHATALADLRRLILGDRVLLARLRAAQIFRNGLKSALGVRTYLRLRRALMRAARSDGSRPS
jgi:peptidoglycan/xylan/chitin deacetylase (PgdA/CDA1 family)